jgi:hypothetical protein
MKYNCDKSHFGPQPSAARAPPPRPRLHILGPCHRKPAADEANDHVAIEAMGAYGEFLSGALRIAASSTCVAGH